INNWLKTLLSYNGKEIFIKSILQSLPTYAFLVFLAPRGHEGLGFCDLCLFSLILLGRKLWRLLTFKDTLCYHVLSSKYFPSGDIFHLKVVNKPSYTWTSIAIAAKALKNGFGWHVGEGNIIDIRKDKWGFEGLNGDSLCSTTLTIYERKVKDLWNNNHTCWNKESVHKLYGYTMGYQICKMPIFFNGLNDIRVWFHNPYGFYTSKFSYSWLLLNWHVRHELLPTNFKISSIRQDFKKKCLRCGVKAETLIDAL
ncbi:hypothetical protein Goari_027322, partial [Gossypium aridum]|nr:hypothetical protein [Gossypium aridum]